MFLQDGFSTLIGFSDEPTVKLKEINVTPPGVSVGKMIDQTTMRNKDVRMAAAARLKSITNGKISVQYDPAVLQTCLSMVGQNQLITVTFPDNSTWSFWGWLDSFTLGALEEGKLPTADVALIPSNLNLSGAEVMPAYVAGS